jgi:site-specific DNA-adenine methylase
MPDQIGPFFSFYGAKWQAGPLYPEPMHNTIIEPFAGAAGYSVRHYDHDVCLFDIDKRILATWDFLIHASPEDILALPLAEEIDSTYTVDGHPGRAALLGYWFNPASTMPRPHPTQRSGWSAKRRERIASWVPLIKHWTITKSSWSSIANTEATWYVDPPYQNVGKYRHPSSAIDFYALGAWCQSRSGQVIVCENEGADWLPFRTFHTINAMRGTSKEVIWTNDPVEVAISA